MKIDNTWTPSTKAIGQFTNNWRQRDVSIYPHPENADLVVTIGVSVVDNKTRFVCEERRVDLARYIGRFGVVVE